LVQTSRGGADQARRLRLKVPEDGGGWLVGGEEGLQSQFGDRDIDRGAEMGQRGQEPEG